MTSEKTTADENRKRVLIALAIALGSRWSSTVAGLDAGYISKAIRYYSDNSLKDTVEVNERIPEIEVQKIAEKAIREAYSNSVSDAIWQNDLNRLAALNKARQVKVVGHLDSRTCPNCREWIGKELSIGDQFKTIDSIYDFFEGHVFHPNCRCSLQAIFKL